MSFTQQNNVPFAFAVQRGNVSNFTAINKFGYNSAVGTSYETIHDGNNLYTYISSAGTATVTSSDTSSDNNGTVEIQGLDANYNLQTVTATIGGSATTETFIRVFRVRMTSANTGTANVGVISVTVSSTVVAKIAAAEGQSLMAVYTIPAKHTAYVVSVNASSSKDLENTYRLRTRQIDEDAFNTKDFFTARGGQVKRDFSVPVKLEAKTDVELQVKGSATSNVSGGFEIILEKTDQS